MLSFILYWAHMLPKWFLNLWLIERKLLEGFSKIDDEDQQHWSPWNWLLKTTSWLVFNQELIDSKLQGFGDLIPFIISFDLFVSSEIRFLRFLLKGLTRFCVFHLKGSCWKEVFEFLYICIVFVILWNS